MSILGNRVERVEDERMLTVGGDYVDDRHLPGAAHVTFVTSMLAHGRIESIELDDARAMPGVVGVFAAADLDLGALPNDYGSGIPRPVLADDKVRYVGEPIVAVVADTLPAAIDAAEAVFVDIEPLDAVVDPLAAIDGPVIHDRSPDNTFTSRPARAEVDFSDCDVVIEADIVNQRVAACPIEPRVAIATWEDGRLVQWAASQGSHAVRDTLADFYGLDPTDVRVITPDVGGGFGAKATVHPEEHVLGALSREVGRPVRWVETRSQNLTGMVQGRAQYQHVRLGGTADGRLTHYRLDVVQDAGAWADVGVTLPPYTGRMQKGVYEIDQHAFSSTTVYTTTTPIGAFRGAGRPEATAALERAVDLFAAEAGLDPADVRRRNFIPPDAFPYDTGTRLTYDCGDYATALDRALDAADYAGLRAEQARRRADGDPVELGIGLAAYVEITAMGDNTEDVTVELRTDGGAIVRSGASPYGQGHDTTWAMIVTSRLGIPMEMVEVHHGDTDEIAEGNVTGGSRSAQVVGSSVHGAAGELLELARHRAADLLEASVDDLVLDHRDGGVFHVAGTPARTVGWADIAATGDEPLIAGTDFEQGDSTFPFGAHVAVVELDTETGAVRLRQHVAVDDAGTIINPTAADGQVHGGLAQGAAQALLESVEYDTDGNPLTTNFADYAIISATELPMFDRVAMETPTPLNPLGAKGIGESATIGSTPAIQNAVCDALAARGVAHVDMPCTPERVWRALQSAAG